MWNESVERRQILALGEGLQDAWNRGDATGYASLFSGDASFVAWNGQHGYGRAAIEEVHRFLFAGPLAGSEMRLTDGEPPSLRFVRPDVAVMVTVGAVTPDDHRAVQTFVLVKDDRQWRTTAFHNTRRQ